MRLAAGARLGAHEIVSPLGAGGMGEVYLATDTRLERQVALKVLPRRMAHDSEAIALFRREALTVASLNHPNIATIFGFEEIPRGPMVLVLEYVEGETLSAKLKRGPLAVEEALRIGAQIAEALEAAHDRGVIHRDVKPGNVMIGPRGLVKVLDFGLARRTAGITRAEVLPRVEPAESEIDTVMIRPDPSPDTNQTVSAAPPPEDAPTVVAPAPSMPSDEAPTVVASESGRLSPSVSGGPDTASLTGMTVGTPGYMSPEQVLAGTLDERTDVFAIGCVLYECLIGRRPFTGRDPVEIMRATLDVAPDLSALPPRTPPRARELITQCLEKEAAARPESMRTVRIVLEEVLGIRRAAALRGGEAPLARHNLPTPATLFVGRQATLAECSAALDQTRMLALVGMGGSGKTRLALKLAENRLESFPDGVWFVDVAPLTEAERVFEALAAALEVREEAGRTLQQAVTAALGGGTALVLLDNAETFPEACGALAAHLLRACPKLRIVVTSRQPLGVEGETVFTVPTLVVPGAHIRRAAEAAAVESVQLFVDRARAASPTFELSDANAEAVAEVCRRLDGIPLALELAAARIRLLGIEQIRARLDDRFKLLTRSSGTVSRQQTVLATIQWSWDHLHATEQDLMRRLAVFTGGWVLERAVSVCSDSGDEFEVLDLLTRLAERALIVVERAEDHSVRYRFLESVWRFALEKLGAHDEHAALRNRHLAIYLELAEQAEKELVGSAFAGAVARLAAEEENILSALGWSEFAPDGVRSGLRIAESTNRYWSLRGRFATGRRVMEEALARDHARAPTLERARVLTRAAGFALLASESDRARAALEEGGAICRQLGDRQGIARSLAGLAVVAIGQGRLADAASICAESRDLYQALGQRRGVAMSLHNLGVIAIAQGSLEEGRSHFEAALPILRASGDTPTEALCLASLASAHTRLGQDDAARSRLLECLDLLAQNHTPREAVEALDSAAQHLSSVRRADQAALLIGASQAAREKIGSRLLPHELADLARLRGQIVLQLGEAAAERAFQSGGGLDLETALARAGALLTASVADSAATSPE